jgi:hypothetical protein
MLLSFCESLNDAFLHPNQKVMGLGLISVYKSRSLRLDDDDALYDTKCIIHNDELNTRSLINEFASHSCIMCVHAVQPNFLKRIILHVPLREYVCCLHLRFYASLNAVDGLVTLCAITQFTNLRFRFYDAAKHA